MATKEMPVLLRDIKPAIVKQELCHILDSHLQRKNWMSLGKSEPRQKICLLGRRRFFLLLLLTLSSFSGNTDIHVASVVHVHVVVFPRKK